MRIFLAQINTTVGDLSGNVSRILRSLDAARAEGADLAVFPELTITGYPPRDLVEKKAFIRDNVKALETVAQGARGVAALVGFAMSNETGAGKALFNAAALCADGRVVATIAKRLLPTYDVFDEERHFEPGRNVGVVDFAGLKIGVSVCEDAWNDPDLWGRRFYRDDPIGEQAAGGARLLVNVSASPFALGRPVVRERLMSAHAAKHGLPLVCVNLVGGNDQILFDGRSCVFDGAGRKVAELDAFREAAGIVDIVSEEGGAPTVRIPRPGENRTTGGPPSGVDLRPGAGAAGTARAPISGPSAPEVDGGRTDAQEAFDALVMGTRDYVAKCGFSSAVLGLSGGIDSSVVAVIAAEALGAKSVTGVSMPSRFSSRASLEDAERLAANLGVGHMTLPIEKVHAAYLETLASVFGAGEGGVAEENIQARIRGNLLMALSNRFGWLVLTTGNKSEMAVGYSTLYGDMSGGLAVISDVPKTLVYDIARLVNAAREVIPPTVLTKPPSAELRPNQTDQDTLPPYDVLDGILRMYVEEARSAREIIAAGYEERTVRDVIRRVDASEYKRSQAPPGLRITTKAFGLGRRMPIAQRYVEP